MNEKIYDSNFISACYFRSIADSNHKKVILQITERCNMFCKHCFVSSSTEGNNISYTNIKDKILPKLLDANVSKITLTGGEPLFHPEIKNIVTLLVKNNISVAICTNGLLANKEFVDMCYNLGNIHFNISLDGFDKKSHCEFRRINSSVFNKIIENIKYIANKKMLNGILVTPNIYAKLEEYEEICIFAKKIGAKYVLFNPLSELGRGQDTKKIGYHNKDLLYIQNITKKYIDDNFEVVYIRFPEPYKKIGNCPLGKILYIFTNGNIAICPYLAFASYDKISIYNPEQFYISNIFNENCNINQDLKNYNLPPKTDDINRNCLTKNECSKGCLAAKVSNGLSIYDCDLEICRIQKNN